LPVDKGRRRRWFAQSEPFNHLFEFGVQPVRLSAVTALATGQPDKAIASVLGEPPLHGPQWNAMMTGNMSQRHLMLNAGL
jgi:hypothetical protein